MVERLGVPTPVSQWSQTIRQQILKQLPRQALSPLGNGGGAEEFRRLFEQMGFESARAHDGMVNQSAQKVGKTHNRRATTTAVMAMQAIQSAGRQAADKQTGETLNSRIVVHV
jgi:hypothetical protein